MIFLKRRETNTEESNLKLDLFLVQHGKAGTVCFLSVSKDLFSVLRADNKHALWIINSDIKPCKHRKISQRSRTLNI